MHKVGRPEVEQRHWQSNEITLFYPYPNGVGLEAETLKQNREETFHYHGCHGMGDALTPVTLVRTIFKKAHVMRQKTPSKIDTVIVVPGIFGIAMGLIGIFCAAPSMPQALFVIVIAGVAAILAFALSIFLNTYYELSGDTLLIRAGLFRWRVPLLSITALSLSGSIMSSPALSLDRILIEYDGGKKILISPLDRKSFLAQLASAAKLEVSADGASAKRVG